MTREELRLDLEAALRRLTPKQAEALLLVCYLGYTQGEAGAICGVSDRAIRYRLEGAKSRAQESLRASEGK